MFPPHFFVGFVSMGGCFSFFVILLIPVVKEGKGYAHAHLCMSGWMGGCFSFFVIFLIFVVKEGNVCMRVCVLLMNADVEVAVFSVKEMELLKLEIWATSYLKWLHVMYSKIEGKHGIACLIVSWSLLEPACIIFVHLWIA